jgi:integrase
MDAGAGAGQTLLLAARLYVVIAVLWRAGLRISEALALTETHVGAGGVALRVRHGEGGTGGFRRCIRRSDWRRIRCRCYPAEGTPEPSAVASVIAITKRRANILAGAHCRGAHSTERTAVARRQVRRPCGIGHNAGSSWPFSPSSLRGTQSLAPPGVEIKTSARHATPTVRTRTVTPPDEHLVTEASCRRRAAADATRRHGRVCVVSSELADLVSMPYL